MADNLYLDVALNKKEVETQKDLLLRVEKLLTEHIKESKERYASLDHKIDSKYDEVLDKIKSGISKTVAAILIGGSIFAGFFTYFYTSPKEKDTKIENNQIELNKQMQEMKLDYLNKYHEIKDFVLETCRIKRQ
jgi:hypothetical protein